CSRPARRRSARDVLINERIRGELRAGKPARAAMEGGYARAFSSIFDGHVTTLIAGFVLLQYEPGDEGGDVAVEDAGEGARIAPLHRRTGGLARAQLPADALVDEHVASGTAARRARA